MQVGTLIFQSIKPKAEFDVAVTQSGNTPTVDKIIDNINHVGLYIGNDQVIEASHQKGVVITPLPAFLAVATYNVAATIKQSDLLDCAIARAKTKLGLPYNHSFYPNDKGLYCSQLITHCFLYKNGRRYFNQYPMKFNDAATGDVIPYWVTYYQALNLPIPQGLSGSHPQQLLRQISLFKTEALLL
ncbi:YiiX/YebB-like N1pC/P60 family cysteine hydrolase [Orbaceae bacterium ac157xtp]